MRCYLPGYLFRQHGSSQGGRDPSHEHSVGRRAKAMRPGLHVSEQRVKVWVQCSNPALRDKFFKGTNPARPPMERATTFKLILTSRR